MRSLIITATLGLVAGVASLAFAEDEAPTTVAIDGAIPDFTITDTTGQKFQLSKRGFDKRAVEASVRGVAEAKGAKPGCPLTTKVNALPGLMDDGTYDADLLLEMMLELGAPYGRIASETNIAEVKTLGDAFKWVMKVEQAPVVFIIWSPNCPTSKTLNDSIHEKLATVEARVYALGSSYRDTDEHYQGFRDMFDFKMRIFPDRELKITDMLGGKRTPHFMVVDSANKLRFRGSLDNDPSGLMDDEEREDWLTDAITAVANGKSVPKTETPGPG